MDSQPPVVSYWNSTSNHNSCEIITVIRSVVSYWNSTSNHNMNARRQWRFQVVSYWNSTSNHNTMPHSPELEWLYLIEILHQTTTASCFRFRRSRLYLIEILHQTTTFLMASLRSFRLYLIEILHQTTTSFLRMLLEVSLYLIEILHQTTTSARVRELLKGCILLKFYIKPQPVAFWSRYNLVVSYWNSTSNHNLRLSVCIMCGLYLIEILHQTTTTCVPFTK